MIKNYSITYFTSCDYEEIISLWEKSVRATHFFLSEDDIVFYKSMLENGYLQNVRLWGIKNSDNRILAFLGVDGNNIEMLFVDPDKRGMGLGRELVKYAVCKLKCNKVDVNEQNEQAVAFYDRMGFVLQSRDDNDSSGKPFPILHLIYH
ncbi:GNAT family N-acetyltransferase [Coprobacter tertius]|uniref:GNAT family N-acetyltransferase n=1 Tax=Coprobacter tertius TaxID=2944915 RepID=A0ABT1MIE8_9BACT|nr:GNAT family N-acetyltransferase [Coprobacter tertius]MCP9612149.1 GNAT family N-acetyltransferase [Coprobacter tertius]